VAVGVFFLEKDLGKKPGLARIGDVEDRRAEALLVGDVADVGVIPGDGDLPRARQLEPREPLHVPPELRFHPRDSTFRPMANIRAALAGFLLLVVAAPAMADWERMGKTSR